MIKNKTNDKNKREPEYGMTADTKYVQGTVGTAYDACLTLHVLLLQGQNMIQK